MDKDESFKAVEIVVPKEEIKKDKGLQPEWKTATFHFLQDKCVMKEHDSDKEASDSYNSFKGEKMLIQKGNIAHQEGEDQSKLGQCMGEAITNGYLKRKTFGKGQYYIVNQTNLGDQPYNIMERFKSLDLAQNKFGRMQTTPGFSKILVDGTTGKIVDKEGPENWVG